MWLAERRLASALAALAIPAPAVLTTLLLGLLGIGLGTYIPANDAQIMAAVADRDAAAAGGLVNMTRGLGTALGVAIVALGLHAGVGLGHPGAGQSLAMSGLAAAALAATWARSRASRPVTS